MKPTKRAVPVSPLREPPLRTPGLSQTRQADEILYEGVVPWFTICVLVIYLGVFEWLRWLLTIPPSAWTAAGFTVAAAALTAYFLLRRWPELRAAIRRHTLGAIGERSVAEVLDGLRCGGYEVFHDLVDNGFNIDHVMVGPTGVYVIETKTRSKHVGRRNVHVTYDGRRILVDGREPDRDPIGHVHALAERVREIIQVETG